MKQETPKGQIDKGKGKIQCDRCGKWNFKGTMMCGWGKCTYSFSPDTYKEKRESDYVSTSRGMDISKRVGADLENTALMGGIEERRLKRAGYEFYMDKINTSINREQNEERRNKMIQIRNNRVINQYNKYNNTNYKY